MNKNEIIEFIRNHPAGHLATCENGQARVRGIHIYRADAEGIIFHTGTTKDLFHQLAKNPSAEFCFNDFQTRVQVRVTGVVQLLQDQPLKEQIVRDRDFLKPWVEKSGYNFLAVFRMTDCRALVWTMASNFGPKEYILLK